MKEAEPFVYPPTAHKRRHGPFGFGDYADYKDWLRDEFDFRCVYCMRRESWSRRRAIWVVEHLIPRALRPDLEKTYSNLVFACATCNSWKSADSMPDPCKVAYGVMVTVADDGSIHHHSREGKKLIRVARLDDADSIEWRRKHIRVIQNFKKNDPEEYLRWMGFPEDLPDLASRRAKNTEPDGAKNCRFEQRKQLNLPPVY